MKHLKCAYVIGTLYTAADGDDDAAAEEHAYMRVYAFHIYRV